MLRLSARITVLSCLLVALAGGVAAAPAAVGDLDPAFGGDGVRPIGLGSESTGELRDVEALPGGGVLLAGRVRGDGTKAGPLLVQLTEDGSFDPALDGDGVIESVVDTKARGAASAVLRLTDGRILLAGWTARGEDGVFVARLLADGSPDPSFSDDGVRTIDVAGGPEVTQSDALFVFRGRIFVGVRAKTPDGDGFKAGVVVLDRHGELQHRYGTDGRVLVPSEMLPDFEHGWLPVDICTGCMEHDLGLDGKGRVLISGSVGDNHTRMAVVRLDREGRIDRDYADQGRAVIRFDRELYMQAGPLVVRPDGSALMAGTAAAVRGLRGYAVAALTSSGRPDPAYSGDGRVIVEFPGPGAFPKDATLDSGGSLLIAGYAENQKLNTFAALARISPGGRPDPGFGDGGALRTGVGNSQMWSVTTDAAGRILAAGFTGNSARPGVIRLLGG